MVLIRKAQIDDLEEVLNIYNDAILKFEEEKTYQWKKGYPNKEIYLSDLKENHLFVATVDSNVVGVMTVLTNGEPDYEKIDGAWLNDSKYYAVHRVAVKKEALGCGVGSKLIEYAINFSKLNGINNIKIDTHELNKDMKRLLERKGFVKCGVIKLKDKNFELRDAYQYYGE